MTEAPPTRLRTGSKRHPRSGPREARACPLGDLVRLLGARRARSKSPPEVRHRAIAIGRVHADIAHSAPIRLPLDDNWFARMDDACWSGGLEVWGSIPHVSTGKTESVRSDAGRFCFRPNASKLVRERFSRVRSSVRPIPHIPSTENSRRLTRVRYARSTCSRVRNQGQSPSRTASRFEDEDHRTLDHRGARRCTGSNDYEYRGVWRTPTRIAEDEATDNTACTHRLTTGRPRKRSRRGPVATRTICLRAGACPPKRSRSPTDGRSMNGFGMARTIN